MKSFENPGEQRPSIEDMIVGGNAEALKVLEGQYPDLMPALEKILDASTSNDTAFEAVDTFNQEHMLEREGMYTTVHLSSSNKNVAVKYYKNGSISISASLLG